MILYNDYQVTNAFWTKGGHTYKDYSLIVHLVYHDKYGDRERCGIIFDEKGKYMNGGHNNNGQCKFERENSNRIFSEGVVKAGPTPKTPFKIRLIDFLCYYSLILFAGSIIISCYIALFMIFFLIPIVVFINGLIKAPFLTGGVISIIILISLLIRRYEKKQGITYAYEMIDVREMY